MVVGRKRVPHPAAGITTVLTLVGDGIVLEPGLGPGLAEEVSLDYAAGERGVGEGGEVEGGKVRRRQVPSTGTSRYPRGR